jgi:hypothetical protein
MRLVLLHQRELTPSFFAVVAYDSNTRLLKLYTLTRRR